MEPAYGKCGATRDEWDQLLAHQLSSVTMLTFRRHVDSLSGQDAHPQLFLRGAARALQLRQVSANPFHAVQYSTSHGARARDLSYTATLKVEVPA